MIYICLLYFIISIISIPNSISTIIHSLVNCSKASLPNYSQRIEKYDVDLSKPPSERWTKIVVYFKKHIKRLIEYVKGYIGENSTNFILNIMSKVIMKLPVEYSEEIKGISVETGLKIEEIALFNIFYELFTMCTSIVAYDQNGQHYHARNLDFGLFMGWDKKNHTWMITEILRDLTIQINWKRNNLTIAKSMNFAGYIGVLTGMNLGKISISLNERFNIDGGYVGLIKWLLKGSGNFVGFYLREIITSSDSSDSLIAKLKQTEFIAPNYLIVATTEKAHIITRSRTKTIEDYQIDKTNTTEWFVLQTNYDHWTKPPVFDDRVTPGNFCMKKIGKKSLSDQKIFEVLQTRPVLNRLSVYTVFMHLNTGQMYGHLVYCPLPCPIW